MKKLKLLLIALCASLTLTGCEEIVKSTYYMKIGSETSVNFSSNPYVQSVVLSSFKASDGDTYYYFGTEDDAIGWFDQECNTMSQPAFCTDITLLDETWANIELYDLGESRTVKTTKVTFTKE